MQHLKGQIAVVTGASRSIGRGIAIVLGEAGATVYVTGRSIRGDSTRPDLPDATIEGTADMVTDRGGVGIPVQCDHTRDDEVEALFQRVQKEQGHVDILVNCAWGGSENERGNDKPFWEQPLWRWDTMFAAGARSNYTASCFAIPLMLPQRRGLIIHANFWDRGEYLAPLPYDLVMAMFNRMAYGMGHELREHHIAVIALSTGVPRNEGFLSPDDLQKEYQVRGEKDDLHEWPEDSFLWKTESTQYIGRAVVALATDPKVMAKSGRAHAVGDLAREYDFRDIDGRQPPPYRIDWTPSSN